MQLVLINLKTTLTRTVVLSKSDRQAPKRTERLQNENRLLNSMMQVTCHNLLQLASVQMLLRAPSKRPASLNPPPLLQSEQECHFPATLKRPPNKPQSWTIIRLKHFTGQGNKIIILKPALPMKWNISEYFQATSNSVTVPGTCQDQKLAFHPEIFKSLSNGKMKQFFALLQREACGPQQRNTYFLHITCKELHSSALKSQKIKI